ncbi:MAG: G5 domain-containing protein, partial [Acidobacteriota bacterium]
MKKKYDVGKQYRPYFNRFHNHPYAIPVTAFLLLFFLSIASFVGLNAKTDPPSDSHIIEFSEEGVRQSIPSRAQTVGEFLTKVNVSLGENDVVEPDIDSRIYGDKYHINVYRARPVIIEEVKTGRTFAYSAAKTPRSVAGQAGIEVYPEDRVESQIPDNFLKEGVLGEKVIIERATPATINLYGSRIDIRTHAKTVRELLEEKNVKLGEKDSIKPALDTALKSGLQIFVFRSGLQIKTVEEEIPMPVEYIEDKSLSFGSQAIRQAGSPGKRVVTYQIELRNGKEISRKVIQEVIAAQPVKQIVARGPQGAFGQALSLLRQCEAGGNYNINTGNGYYGAYQFNISTWNGYGGYTVPSDAPPAIQDQKATETYQGRGWQPWPGCTSKL